MADNLFTLSPSASQAFAAYNCGVYRIVNVRTGACYVGASNNIKDRIYNHFNLLKRGKHNPAFQKAYDLEKEKVVFQFELVIVLRSEDLVYFEQKAIRVYNPEYNLKKVAVRGEKPVDFGDRISKGLTEFYKTPAGEQLSLRKGAEHSVNLKALYQTSKGKKICEQISKKKKEYFKTPEGREHKNKVGETLKRLNTGEGHPNAKISEETALIILNTKGTNAEIARKYGVTTYIVYAIKNGYTWKHLKKKASQ